MITFIVASSAAMVIHCCSCFDDKRSVVRDFYWGGFKVFWNIYDYDYAEFDSKMWYIMFLHDYLLACEISTVCTTPNGFSHC